MQQQWLRPSQLLLSQQRGQRHPRMQAGLQLGQVLVPRTGPGGPHETETAVAAAQAQLESWSWNQALHLITQRRPRMLPQPPQPPQVLRQQPSPLRLRPR